MDAKEIATRPKTAGNVRPTATAKGIVLNAQITAPAMEIVINAKTAAAVAETAGIVRPTATVMEIVLNVKTTAPAMAVCLTTSLTSESLSLSSSVHLFDKIYQNLLTKEVNINLHFF